MLKICLISDTHQILKTKEQFELVHLGNIELRGKQDKIDLSTVRLHN